MIIIIVTLRNTLSSPYFAKDGGLQANMEIIRLDKRVSPSSRSSRIKFPRCHRASFSWFADFSRRHDASRIAREQIFDVIFLPALCPFVRPLVGSSPRTLSPANFLFSLPHFPQVRSLSCFRNQRDISLYSSPPSFSLLPLLITFLSFLIIF